MEKMAFMFCDVCIKYYVAYGFFYLNVPMQIGEYLQFHLTAKKSKNCTSTGKLVHLTSRYLPVGKYLPGQNLPVEDKIK